MSDKKEGAKSTTEFPDRLLAGYCEYKQGMQASEREHLQALAEHGQKPETLVIACCDSRAAPETIFNTMPGEIFVVRNVANLVPSYQPDGSYHSTSAALEFAVQSLKVKHVVVLGHGRCGGIKAALDPAEEALSPGDFIGKWMELLEPVADSISANKWLTAEERQMALERISIRHSIDNLRTFPCVNILEGKGRLKLHGAWFDISTGELWIMNPETGDFIRQD
ncbi:MAG: carbonic anhydrase [Hyphomicrobiales bacterium]